MKSFKLLARSVSAAALLALCSTPALAESSKEDRAKQAIAEARGKIDAADKAGTGGEVPGLQARARATLRAAEESLAAGHKTEAILTANRASSIADTAIGVANKQRIEAEQAQRDNATAATVAAQQDASAAQDSAAAANARAAAAEQSAAVANAQAEALRNTPPPAPTTTVVTTTDTTRRIAAVPAKKKVVRRVVTTKPVRSATEKTTTTTITTAPAGG